MPNFIKINQYENWGQIHTDEIPKFVERTHRTTNKICTLLTVCKGVGAPERRHHVVGFHSHVSVAAVSNSSVA
jgi:hypothetical protein